MHAHLSSLLTDNLEMAQATCLHGLDQGRLTHPMGSDDTYLLLGLLCLKF